MLSVNKSLDKKLRHISYLISARGRRSQRESHPREPVEQTHLKEPEKDGGKHDSAVFMNDSLPMPKEPAIHKLPMEIIQEIASYLSSHETASFCLSSRFTCYAVGTQQLHLLLRAAFYSKHDRRANTIIVERAFPSHWFCAWCDKFHRHDRAGGPLNFSRETKRECAQFNSFLHCERDFVLAYHHVRLALNRHLWGQDYGIPLEHFTFSSIRSPKILRTSCQMETFTKARIVANQFILHAGCSITIPLNLRLQTGIANEISKAMPHVVVGHRSREHGHKYLVSTLEAFLSLMPPEEFLQSNVKYCGQCSTDYHISCRYQGPPRSDLGKIEVVVEVWRNLGVGRSPFETLWRAHGEAKGQRVVGKDKTWDSVGRHQAGEIKDAFQSGGEPERLGMFGTLHGEALVPKVSDEMRVGGFRRP